ncbi:unnamed protein product [Musa acuminata subsp. malaccensis]|uniref:(wild Malaysian banana) hypothetical protein n=1 Tax=Musa acuminata subsp. malaccensis TaxID=214687 RepID=A0A804IMF6_MUSAM|nr:PREDICTED: uncharacterized protein LOC103980935 isoform X1 [Musa acuminata subsp. malaccensis]CAG1841571.1 unnamed protein product [Musa acuminata subsp. malaccensis]
MPSALKPSTTTSAGGDHGGGDEKSKDTPVAAKTIGFLVVFGIAASIAKALLTKPNPHPQRPRGPRMGFSNRAVSGDGWDDGPSSARKVVIAKGDTLWGHRRCDQGSKWDHRKQDLRRKEADHPLTDLNLSVSVTSLTSSSFSFVVGFMLE